MRNGGELSDLEHLLTKTEYMKYLQIADTRTSRLFGPFLRVQCPHFETTNPNP